MRHPVFINLMYTFLRRIRMIEYHYYYEVKWEKGVWSPNLVSNKQDLVSEKQTKPLLWVIVNKCVAGSVYRRLLSGLWPSVSPLDGLWWPLLPWQSRQLHSEVRQCQLRRGMSVDHLDRNKKNQKLLKHFYLSTSCNSVLWFVGTRTKILDPLP